MNRVSPESVSTPRRIVPALVAAAVLLAMLPLLTRGADAVTGPTIDVVIEDSSPTSIFEPGAKTAFGIEVTNTSPGPVTITAATESLDGGPEYDISLVHGEVLSACDDNNNSADGNIVGAVLAAGEAYSCSFIIFVGGDVGDVLTEVVTVTVQDGGGATGSDQDQRSRTILDALPTVDVGKSASVSSVIEPGADVTYTAEVENTSREPVTITAATESIDGGPAYDLSSVNGPILQTTCGDAVGKNLDPEDTYSCSFVVRVSGAAGDLETDTVTFTVEDDEGNSTSGQATATVAVKTESYLADVPTTAWFARYVRWMGTRDITNGCARGFCPYDSVTRAEVAAFLYRMAGEPPVTGTHPYGDLRYAWQHDPVTWMHQQGITFGCTPGKFCPNRRITRGEISAFVHRYSGLLSPTQAHGYLDVLLAWQQDPVAWMRQYEITQGCGGPNYCPGRFVTRAEAAAFLYRLADQWPQAWGNTGRLGVAVPD